MSSGTADRRAALANVADIVVSPGTAFERLRATPTWGWAFLVATLLGIAGTLMVVPALLHAADTSLPAHFAAMPQIAKLPPEQQSKVIATQMQFIRAGFTFAWIFIPVGVLLIGALQAIVMLIANAAAHGDGTFKKFFALSETVAVVGIGLASIVAGAIVAVRGANSFETVSSVQTVAPSLALLAPGIHGAAAGFLGAFNVFTLWATVLLALGMMQVGRVPRVAAGAAAAFMLLVTAAYAAFGAAQNG